MTPFRRPHVRFGTIAAAVALLAAAGCGSGGATGAAGAGATTGAGGKPNIVAAFYPLAWLSAQVGGPDATITNLTKPGTEPHDLELTSRQVVEVGQARLVVYISGIQPAVDTAVRQHAAKSAFDAASVVAPLPAAGDETDHAEQHSAATGYDPHIWLDPTRLATVAGKLGERLAAIDPGHAAGYRARAQQTAAKLTELDGEYRTGLTTCRQRTILTSHAAFAYLADRYHLKQVGISGLDPESEPSPARLAEVAKLARQEQVTTIFYETLVSPKVAQTLAREVGVKSAQLDPVEGLAPGSSDDYLSVMRRNLTTLKAALQCR